MRESNSGRKREMGGKEGEIKKDGEGKRYGRERGEEVKGEFNFHR